MPWYRRAVGARGRAKIEAAGRMLKDKEVGS